MFAIERQNIILEHIKEHGKITTQQICEKFTVSATTARNDMKELEERNLITRTHGGATLTDKQLTMQPDITHIFQKGQEDSYSFLSREKKCTEEKEHIAQKALSYITERGSIYLDSGTTALVMAKKLAAMQKKLIVVTHGIHIMSALISNPNITVIFVGGIVGKDAAYIEGTLGSGIFDNLNIDLAFVSGYGMTIKSGLTDFNPYEVELKRIVVKHSHKIIALVDSSKFDVVSTANFCPTDSISTIITDPKVSPDVIHEYQDKSINIVY
ncbi:DeoR/GlpR family DNA-binding transcription regulator [Pectinatus haikarae]|uniref:DeoR/GlpR family transcriptional regulator of sugar metabolism n=1 Tax=Pectinatus haikarae TaxID=349096 RepID=A0ABT9YBM6_9FIRM|nr:DeoR/GlpR family DNA-binding transcription regulator [Pectinatus haikarae]MDQ0205121.1 DeoR/GlpR family transcriptional regulator of sugar metabolism [Pectinatus haikarae]